MYEKKIYHAIVIIKWIVWNKIAVDFIFIFIAKLQLYVRILSHDASNTDSLFIPTSKWIFMTGVYFCKIFRFSLTPSLQKKKQKLPLSSTNRIIASGLIWSFRAQIRNGVFLQTSNILSCNSPDCFQQDNTKNISLLDRDTAICCTKMRIKYNYIHNYSFLTRCNLHNQIKIVISAMRANCRKCFF